MLLCPDPMARRTLALLAACLGLALAAPAQAQWKWRDKNGQTQYSDLPPPPAVPEQDILSRPAAAKQRADEVKRTRDIIAADCK
jgi:hypothetical protein